MTVTVTIVHAVPLWFRVVQLALTGIALVCCGGALRCCWQISRLLRDMRPKR